jgi:hypothetical protein
MRRGTRFLLTLRRKYEDYGNHNKGSWWEPADRAINQNIQNRDQLMKTLKSNRLLKGALAILCCSFAFAASSAWATLVTWNLNPSGTNADLATNSQSYTVSGFTITARGYDNSGGIGSPHNLHFKNLGPSERGLGITGTADFELQVNGAGVPLHFIQLDLTSILSQGFTNGQIEVGSIQAGESWNLYGSNTLGSLGVKLNSTAFGSSTDETFVNVPNFGQYSYISVVTATGDVLPVAFQATFTPIPEAASVIPVLCLITVATAIEIRRRRRVS